MSSDYWLGFKKFSKFINKFFLISCLTFPYYKNFPAVFSQPAYIPFISCNITFTFCLPEFGISSGLYLAIAAFVHVPETAMDEYYILIMFIHKKHYIKELYYKTKVILKISLRIHIIWLKVIKYNYYYEVSEYEAKSKKLDS